jgi:hypothetical protein
MISNTIMYMITGTRLCRRLQHGLILSITIFLSVNILRVSSQEYPCDVNACRFSKTPFSEIGAEVDWKFAVNPVCVSIPVRKFDKSASLWFFYLQ